MEWFVIDIVILASIMGPFHDILTKYNHAVKSQLSFFLSVSFPQL